MGRLLKHQCTARKHTDLPHNIRGTNINFPTIPEGKIIMSSEIRK
jgi:hypothetical protein